MRIQVAQQIDIVFHTHRTVAVGHAWIVNFNVSAEYWFVQGQLRRSPKRVAIRGLNANHNPDLKNLFKGAATRAAAVAGPFQEFYAALVARGMKPAMARITLARKIAAITLIVWKKGIDFDAKHLKPQAA
jgi:hypothetical protein